MAMYSIPLTIVSGLTSIKNKRVPVALPVPVAVAVAVPVAVAVAVAHSNTKITR